MFQSLRSPLVSQYILLSDAEAQAIAYHDGMYVPEGRSVAHKEEPLLLHSHEKYEPTFSPHGEYFRKPEDVFMASAVYHYGNERRKSKKTKELNHSLPEVTTIMSLRDGRRRLNSF